MSGSRASRSANLSSSTVSNADAFAFDTTGYLYEHDPAGFVLDCVDWAKLRKNDRPTPYQLEALTSVVAENRFALRGPHGLGKTALNAWLVLWFSLTREALGRDWKLPTTAGSWLQLKKFLWPEVHKWSRLLRWEIIGRPPLAEGRELLDLSIKLTHGEAFAVPSNQPSKVEGAHADSMLFIFDESKAIADPMFDAAEGAFSGAGGDTGREAYAVATSTPGPMRGRFYEIHSKKRGLEQWKVRHVKSDEAIKAGRMSLEWRDARKRQWGETSAIYMNRALGEFANDAQDSVIPLQWIELAIERWHERVEAVGRPRLSVEHPDEAFKGRKPRRLTSIGGDVSYGGADRSMISMREEDILWQIDLVRVEAAKNPNAQIAGRIAHLQRIFGGVAVVDVVGWGAGCVEMLRLMEPPVPVIAFSAGSKAVLPDANETPIKDASGEIGFVDLRSAGYWYLRMRLDPEGEHPIALPPDDALPDEIQEYGSLIGDLSEPKWSYSSGRIRVESKDDLRKPDRLGRSTDIGDVVMQAFVYDYLKNTEPIGSPIIIGEGSTSRWRAAN